MLYLGNKYKKRRQINHKFLILYNIKKTLISQIHTDAFCVNQCQSVGLTYSPTNFTNTHGFFPC